MSEDTPFADTPNEKEKLFKLLELVERKGIITRVNEMYVLACGCEDIVEEHNLTLSFDLGSDELVEKLD